MNFRYESESRDTHYEASEDLMQLFDEEFEDVDSLKIALDGLFEARVDNQLSWELPSDFFMSLTPDVSGCDGKQMEMINELVAQDDIEMQSELKLHSQGEFLDRVLEELVDGHYDINLNVSHVIESIKGLNDLLNKFDSEDLQDEGVQTELNNLMVTFDSKNMLLDDLVYEEEDEEE